MSHRWRPPPSPLLFVRPRGFEQEGRCHPALCKSVGHGGVEISEPAPDLPTALLVLDHTAGREPRVPKAKTQRQRTYTPHKLLEQRPALLNFSVTIPSPKKNRLWAGGRTGGGGHPPGVSILRVRPGSQGYWGHNVVRKHSCRGRAPRSCAHSTTLTPLSEAFNTHLLVTLVT